MTLSSNPSSTAVAFPQGHIIHSNVMELNTWDLSSGDVKICVIGMMQKLMEGINMTIIQDATPIVSEFSRRWAMIPLTTKKSVTSIAHDRKCPRAVIEFILVLSLKIDELVVVELHILDRVRLFLNSSHSITT